MRVLTFDIEDWFHILEYEGAQNVSSWSQFEERIDIGLQFILDNLRTRDITATFFILGWIAEHYPDKVKRISDAGHQIANHSFSHQLVYKQTPQIFKDDLDKAISAIHSATNQVTTIFRAPGFSITNECQWAFTVLHDLGFTVDASLFLAPRAHGGFEGINYSKPFILELGMQKNLIEFPTIPGRFFGFNIPFTGGGYFRLLPSTAQRLLNLRLQKYSMWYFHPREFDPFQPKLPDLTMMRSFKTYVGLRNCRAKFSKLLDENDFVSIGAALDLIDEPNLLHHTL